MIKNCNVTYKVLAALILILHYELAIYRSYAFNYFLPSNLTYKKVVILYEAT